MAMFGRKKADPRGEWNKLCNDKAVSMVVTECKQMNQKIVAGNIYGGQA
jgi:hypothetical protein